MPVPVIFSTFPGGSSIPLADLDLNFAYLTASPAFTGSVNIGGNLSVTGSSNLIGPVTANDLTVNGNLTIDGVTVNPTGVTGTNLLVLNNGPTLVAPILGTPASGNLANCTNLPIASVNGLATGVLPFLTNPTTANLAAAVVDETGTGNLVLSNNPTLTSPTFVAPVLGTPASGNLSACTGYPAPNLSGVVPVANGGTGLSATGTVGQVLGVSAPGVLGYFSAPPSANLAGGAASQLVYQSAANTTGFIPNGTSGQVLLSNGAAVPSWGQVDLTVGVTNVLPIAQGGTNSSTRQQAMDTLAGGNTLGQYLRGNGTNVVMSPILAADVPTLNQNTTGSAATFTSTTQNSQFNSIGVNVAPSGVAGQINATGNIQTSTGFFSDSTGTLHPLVPGTAVAASGPSVVFGGIPNWVNRVTVVYSGVTTSSSTPTMIQLGTSGGIVTTGYVSNCVQLDINSNLSNTSGFNTNWYSSHTADLVYTLYRVTGNQWESQLSGFINNSSGQFGIGRITLGSALTQISCGFIGAGNYTGGTINIMYE